MSSFLSGLIGAGLLSPRLPAARRAKQQHMNDQIAEQSEDLEKVRLATARRRGCRRW